MYSNVWCCLTSNVPSLPNTSVYATDHQLSSVFGRIATSPMTPAPCHSSQRAHSVQHNLFLFEFLLVLFVFHWMAGSYATTKAFVGPSQLTWLYFQITYFAQQQQLAQPWAQPVHRLPPPVRTPSPIPCCNWTNHNKIRIKRLIWTSNFVSNAFGTAKPAPPLGAVPQQSRSAINQRIQHAIHTYLLDNKPTNWVGVHVAKPCKKLHNFRRCPWQSIFRVKHPHCIV